MEKKNIRKFSAEFKEKVVLEALKKRNTVEELAKRYELQPNQIHSWKKGFLKQRSICFLIRGETD
jgi:transposase